MSNFGSKIIDRFFNVESLSALALMNRAIPGIFAVNLTAPVYEGWGLIIYVLLGVAHLYARWTDQLKVRRLCCFLSWVVWCGLSLEFLFNQEEYTSTFPILAIFMLVAYIKNRD